MQAFANRPDRGGHVRGTSRRARPSGIAFSALTVLAWLACAGCSSGSGGGFGFVGGPGPAIADNGGGPLQPTFSKTTIASTSPPPVSGGTLLVMNDGKHAVAADPARDAIYVVDLGAKSVLHTITLSTGDEPGRVAEDGAGHVHVALRGGGAVVTIDPLEGSILARRSACPAPRGVTWDPSSNLLWVACATGELVSMPAAGGGPITQTTVERDLRDVIVNNGTLSVSTFRSAEVLRLSFGGAVARRDALPSPDTQFAPHVAWRSIAGPSGSVISVHQASTTQSLSTMVQGGYGGGGGCASFGISSSSGGGVFGSGQGALSGPGDDGGADAASPVPTGTASGPGCFTTVDALVNKSSSPMFGPVGPSPCGPESGAVKGVLTVVASDGTVTVNQEFPGVLPVDVAVSRDGLHVAAVATGNAFTQNLSTVVEFDGCGAPALNAPTSTLQATAVAFDAHDDVVMQTREPASLVVFPSNGGTSTTIPLSTDSRADTGFDIFHTQAGGMIACGSCHPDGGDDGHVWV
ncbi:MAG: YncE family protein, partial [Polyangiaceae bacterium]